MYAVQTLYINRFLQRAWGGRQILSIAKPLLKSGVTWDEFQTCWFEKMKNEKMMLDLFKTTVFLPVRKSDNNQEVFDKTVKLAHPVDDWWEILLIGYLGGIEQQ